MTIKWKKFILTRRSYPSLIGAPSVTRINIKKKEYEKAENTFLNYNKLVIELVEEEEKKEKKYVQLEFEFDEDLVAPI